MARSIGPALAGSHRSLGEIYQVFLRPSSTWPWRRRSATGAVAARMTGAGSAARPWHWSPSDLAAGAVGLAVAEAFTAAGFGPPAVFPVWP